MLRIQLGSHFGKMNNLDLLFSEFLERNPHPGVTYFYIAVDMEKEYMKRRLRICNTIYSFTLANQLTLSVCLSMPLTTFVLFCYPA